MPLLSGITNRPARSSFSARRLIVQLVVAAGLLNSVVIISVVFALRESYQHYNDQAVISTRNLTQLLDHDISASLGQIDKALSATAIAVQRQLIFGKPNVPKLQEMVAAQLENLPEVQVIRVADTYGKISAFAPVSIDQQVSLAELGSFVEARDGNRSDLLIGSPVLGRTTHQWAITLTRRINRVDGSFAGVVQAIVTINHFQQLFAQLNLGDNGAISVRTADLRLITRYPAPLDYNAAAGSAPVSSELIQALHDAPESGSYTAITKLDGTRRVNSYRRLVKYPIYVLVGISTDEALAQWRNEVAKSAILVLLFLGFTLLLAWLIFTAWLRREKAILDVSRREHRFRKLIELAPDALIIVNLSGRIVLINQQTRRLFGYSEEALIGKQAEILLIDSSRNEYMEMLGQVASNVYKAGTDLGGGIKRDLQARATDGREFFATVIMGAIELDDGTVITIDLRDITDRKLAEQRIEFLAYHDALTELPNRLLAHNLARQAMSDAEYYGARVALLLIDIDKFKTINDSLGHNMGDMLLRVFAQHLCKNVRPGDTVARLGGDEFLIVLSGVEDADTVLTHVAQILNSLEQPLRPEQQEILISVSVGIAVYPDDGSDFETLLRKADIAMYRAKDVGRGTYRFFDSHMNIDAVAHLHLRNGLRRALDQDEFVLYYQPQINLESGKIIGAEALIRWNHPESGLIPPARFIAIAEDSGLIVPIGEWVLHQACRQIAAWSAAGWPLTVAVNLSAVQFKRGDLEQTVMEAVQSYAIDPKLLELELTESILIQDTESVLATLQHLNKIGIRLSIDDFGTGYSSLAYLKRFRVNKLKIDQTFVRDICTDPDDAVIVGAIIQLARSLSLQTIAEGVEDIPTLNALRKLECDEAQGFYFAHPMTAGEFFSFLQTWKGIPEF